jgi:hypothetical protein
MLRKKIEKKTKEQKFQKTDARKTIDNSRHYDTKTRQEGGAETYLGRFA